MEDQNDEEGYTVDKELLINAWCKFRPMGADEKKSESGSGSKRMDSKRSLKKKTKLDNVNDIFGDLLVYDIMRGFHLKLYNFSEMDEELE